MSKSPRQYEGLGVQKGAALVVPYTPEWVEDFALEKRRLHKAMSSEFIIEHVGSTAVPGLAAKPIIDILVGLRDDSESQWEARRANLTELGYEYKGSPFTPGDHIFIRTSDGFTHTHKIHLTEFQGDEWNRKIAFRDFLIANPTTAHTYGQLKTKLARTFQGDRREYSRRKDNFIRGILEQL